MQAGDDNINRVVYVPFTTMSDLKDTHYLDSIWFNYETNDYERIEQSVRYIMAAQHKFNPADRRAMFVFNLMDQVHHSRSSPSASRSCSPSSARSRSASVASD